MTDNLSVLFVSHKGQLLSQYFNANSWVILGAMLFPEFLAVAYERISLVRAYLTSGEVGRIKTF